MMICSLKIFGLFVIDSTDNICDFFSAKRSKVYSHLSVLGCDTPCKVNIWMNVIIYLFNEIKIYSTIVINDQSQQQFFILEMETHNQ